MYSKTNITRALKHLRKDPILAKAIDGTSIKFEIKITRNKYRALTKAIITQQLSSHSANAISERFKALYNTPTYPEPIDVAATPKSKLRRVGLSDKKIECIKEVSRRIKNGHLVLDQTGDMPDNVIIDMLTEIKGIGRWTAEIFLIFGLGRKDVLPVGDLGLRKGIKIFYNLSEMPSIETVETIAEKWRPYRTIATWYIWKAQQKSN